MTELLMICIIPFILIKKARNDKQLKKYESLKAWKQFYVECNNEFEAMKVDYKILRLEERHFE